VLDPVAVTVTGADGGDEPLPPPPSPPAPAPNTGNNNVNFASQVAASWAVTVLLTAGLLKF
jgi:hypothetical protein